MFVHGAPIEFRADIEGLRAISILGVVLFHSGLSLANGGFVGVDSFFVVSGFLITSLLMREVETTGGIKLSAFWARRAKRLLPNALLTIAATLVAVALFGPWSMKESITLDAIAAVFYVANYHFANRTVDYFDETVQSSPLLHFWSLGVEEQFYIVWPLLLIAALFLRRTSPAKAVFTALLFVTLVSFVASLIWIQKNQPAAFFHTEARIWQIGVGGLLAMSTGALRRIPAAVLALAGWAGFTGLIASMVFYSVDLTYPGLWALLPVASTAALIAGGNAHRLAPVVLLQAPPLQWLGRLSYSIYLWHWPIIVMTPLIMPDIANAKAVALALVLPVSALAYYLVENPLRRARWTPPRPKATIATGLAGSSMIAALALMLTVLLPSVGGTAQKQFQSLMKNTKLSSAKLKRHCRSGGADGKIKPCIFGDKGSSKVVALFGDSHAGHLFDGLDEAAKAKGWALQVFVKHACPPIDVEIFNASKRVLATDCTKWRNMVLEHFIAAKPQLVIISSWTGLSRKMYVGASGAPLEQSESLKRWKNGFERVLARLTQAGVNVAVIRNTPKNRRGNILDCIAQSGPDNCGTARQEAVMSSPPDVEVARRLKDVEVYDLTDHFCGRNVCQAVINGVIVYRDATHVTSTFAKTLAGPLAELLD
jgi:peptidoglycan/LPS O-acetylase OafA/YrhL